MDKLQVYKADLEKYLKKKNAFTDVLSKIETKTGVDKVKQTLALGAVTTLYLMIGYGGSFLASFIGFLYPAYCSIKAIESVDKEDDTKWLTYWVVYAAFGLVETFADLLFFWIPLYALIKCAFLVFLMAPGKWNGSIILYHKVIKPNFLKYEHKIDLGFEQAKTVGSDVFNEGSKLVNERMSEVASAAVKRQIDDAMESSSDNQQAKSGSPHRGEN